MNEIVEELKQRGLWAASFGPIEKELVKGARVYVGTDPTNPLDGSKASLHVGHLLMFTTARLLQSYGIQPIILIGTATCSLGDPSGKDAARAMMSMDRVMENTKAITEQVKHLLDFDESSVNHAIIVNNYDWLKSISFLDFEREIGSCISVNSMLKKDSVRLRIEREGVGISHQEFSYMLLQGADYLHLYKEMGVKVQMAGNDQQSNCGIGIDLIHKKLGKDDACGYFWPLITNADGSKIGKSTGGRNVWLDAEKTSPFQFMQYWLNLSDADAEKFIKIFTLIPLDEINVMIAKHREKPHERLLQKELAKYMTCMVHSKEDYEEALRVTDVVFGNGDATALYSLEEKVFKDLELGGLPTFTVMRDEIINGISATNLAVMHHSIPSKNEARKLICGNGFSVNKNKVSDERKVFDHQNLIHDKYMLIQKGRKDYSLIKAV